MTPPPSVTAEFPVVPKYTMHTCPGNCRYDIVTSSWVPFRRNPEPIQPSFRERARAVWQSLTYFLALLFSGLVFGSCPA